MENNIRITKLPDAVNPNKIIQKKVREDFLENNGNVGIRNSVWGRSWYGKHDEREHPFRNFFRFWEKNQSWRTDYYHCNACGGEWESEPYPLIDIKEIV